MRDFGLKEWRRHLVSVRMGGNLRLEGREEKVAVRVVLVRPGQHAMCLLLTTYYLLLTTYDLDNTRCAGGRARLRSM